MGKILIKNRIYLFVLGMILYTSSSDLSQFEIPHSDLQSAMTHQKELMGTKRAPASAYQNQKADQVVSQLVLEIVNQNLPEKFKAKSVKIASAIVKESNRYGLDPLFVASIIRQESHFNPHAVGSVGELGLMQIRPTTAQWLNNKYKIVKKVNLKDPVTNIKIGTFYINKLRSNFFKNSHHYITAYNMGSAKLKKKLAKNEKPKEYVENVMKHYIGYVSRLNKAFSSSIQDIELIEMPIPASAKLAQNE